MKARGMLSIWYVATLAAFLQAHSVSAQQLVRAPTGSDTDLFTSDAFTRTYRINPNLFRLSVDEAIVAGLTAGNKDIQDLVRDCFTAAGIDLSGERAPRFFFNERVGLLTVQGTIGQLEGIEKALKALINKPAHVMVEVRLMESTSEIGNRRLNVLLPQFEGEDFVLPSALPLQGAADSSPALRTAILTQEEFAKLLRSAGQSEGIDILRMPPTVTINGRQARIAVEQPYEMISDPPFQGMRRIKLNAE